MNIAQIKGLSEDEAREMVESIRWENGKACPHCGNCDQAKLGSIAANEATKVRAGLYICRECKKQFTVTVGTVMESSKLSMRIWLYIIASMVVAKKGVSAKQIQREFGSKNYEAIWFACHRVRHALSGGGALLGGSGRIVEADETYIGGKPRNPHGPHYKTTSKKTPVVTLVERGGASRTVVVPNVTAATLRHHLTTNADKASSLMTDEHLGYRTVGKEFASHGRSNHGKREFSSGGVNSNTAESFFAILKRSIYGTYHHYSVRHMQRYLDERDFMWTERKTDDVERVFMVLRRMGGKRLTMHAAKA